MKTLVTLFLLLAGPVHSQSVEWTGFYGGDHFDAGYMSVPTSDGSYLMVGETYTYKSFDKALISGYLVKMRPDGTVQWQRGVGSSEVTRYFFIAGRPDGGYSIVGETKTKLMTPPDSIDIQLTTIDTAGTVIAEKRIGSPDREDHFYTVIQTNDGNILIVAGVGSAGEVGIYKVDPDGNVLWSRVYFGGPNIYVPSKVHQLADGSYTMVGETHIPTVTTEDMFLFRFSANGDSLWVRSYGSSMDRDYGSVVAPNKTGFIIAGFRRDSISYRGVLVMVDSSGILQSWNVQSWTSRTFYLSDGEVMNDGTIMLLGYEGHHASWHVILASISPSGETLSSIIVNGDGTDWVTPRTVQEIPGGVLVTGEQQLQPGDGSQGGTDAFVLKVAVQPSSTSEESNWIEKLDLY